MSVETRDSIPRLRIVYALAVVTPLGFYTKLYHGPLEEWMHHQAGGIFYEIFWCLIVILLWPNALGRIVAFWVFLATSILEFAQLWHPTFLEILRSTFLGETILGNSFSWTDFPYYILGCGIGWLLIGLLRIKTPR